MDRKLAQTIVAECLSGHVRKMGRVVNGIFDGRFRPFGVRSSQVNILVVVAAQGPLAPADVCRALCLDKSTLSRDLDRLIDRDLIRATPGKGRSLQLEITESGRELIRRLKPAWSAAQAETKKILGRALTEEICRVADEELSAAGRKR